MNAFKRFEGDFALAIWDSKNRKLFLARDRFGVKPLYFSNSNNFFRFGSTLQSIIAKKDIEFRARSQNLYICISHCMQLCRHQTQYLKI